MIRDQRKVDGYTCLGKQSMRKPLIPFITESNIANATVIAL